VLRHAEEWEKTFQAKLLLISYFLLDQSEIRRTPGLMEIRFLRRGEYKNRENHSQNHTSTPFPNIIFTSIGSSIFNVFSVKVTVPLVMNRLRAFNGVIPLRSFISCFLLGP
jgi:hypothetical protein